MYFWAMKITAPQIRTNADGKQEVLDPVRKKYVALTPEESVRQGFIIHLQKALNVPLGCIGVERGIKIYNQPFRIDLQVFGIHGSALWLIECKRREQALDAGVMEQISRYQLSEEFESVRFLTITNGVSFYCWEREMLGLPWTLRETLPSWQNLLEISRTIC